MLSVESELMLSIATRPNGETIRCVIESPVVISNNAPTVIIVPPYGRTMCEMFATALYLTYNGLRALRFDFTHHVGASDGDIFDFTLSSAVEDLRAVTDHVRSRYESSPLGIISSSLGSRAAFRALRGREDIKALVSLVGVVNVQKTLSGIIGIDLVSDQLNGVAIPPSWEIFGYRVSTDFIGDIIGHDLYSLKSTREDVIACNFPLAQISAESDPWTRLDEVESVFRHYGSDMPRDLYLLSGAAHKLENNPTAARNALRQAIKVFKHYLAGEEIQVGEVRCPSFQDIVKKNRQERDLEKRAYRSSHFEMDRQVMS